MKKIAALLSLTPTTALFAHEGHGLHGSHWHATDTWGWMVVAALAVVAFWTSRK